MGWLNSLFPKRQKAWEERWSIKDQLVTQVHNLLRENGILDYEIVLVSEGEGARAVREGDECLLVVRSQREWEQLGSWEPWSVRDRVESGQHFHVTLTIIGIDSRGFIYANAKVSSSANHAFEVSTCEGWQTRARICLEQDGALRHDFDIQEFSVDDLFREESLAALCSWTSIVPGFDRNVAREDTWCDVRIIAPLIGKLPLLGLAHMTYWDGGLSNFYSVFVFPREQLINKQFDARREYYHLRGVIVNFSLCAPVAVMGHDENWVSETGYGIGTLSINALESGDGWEGWERELAQLIRATPYRILSSEQVDRPLPKDLEPAEEPEGLQPLSVYKVYHALFQTTD